MNTNIENTRAKDSNEVSKNVTSDEVSKNVTAYQVSAMWQYIIDEKERRLVKLIAKKQK